MKLGRYNVTAGAGTYAPCFAPLPSPVVYREHNTVGLGVMLWLWIIVICIEKRADVL